MSGRSRGPWVVAALALAAASPAHAQEKLCAGTYTHPELLASMDQADAYMRDLKLKEARVTLYAARELVPCLDTIVKTSYLGRFTRQIALLEFLSQDEDAAARWAALSQAFTPTLPWPADIPADHPFRELAQGGEPLQQTGPTDKGFIVPKGGGAFVNGVLVTVPLAWADAQNVFQVADGEGRLVSAYWIDGAGFLDSSLGPVTKPLKPPKWWVPEAPEAVTSMVLPLVFGEPVPVEGDGEDGEPAVATVDPPPPVTDPVLPPEPVAPAPPLPERTTRSGPSIALLGAGGGAAILAGTLYAVAGATGRGMETATSEQELVSARSRTNGLTMGAGVAGAAAVGLAGGSLLFADGWGIRMGGRF